jgi:hypothetical protein
VDDFFAVFVGSILAVVFGIVATLYVQTYIAPNDTGAFQVSQAVWGLFLILNVTLAFGLRELMREVFERRWRAGLGLKRILIAGSGELGRLVADKIIEHRELGYQIVGFVDDRAEGDHLGYRGLPLLGTIEEAAPIALRESIDHLYVALPPDQHLRMIDLIESTSRECIDVKVVPDLLQVIALRARLEDLDGVPVINVNDVPLQGFNSVVKRGIDMAISALALAVLAIPLALVAAVVRLTSKGSVFYHQERMGLDGKTFTIVKVPIDVHDAERDTGPVWAQHNDRGSPRSDASFAARTSTNCRNSGTCCGATCRSWPAPRAAALRRAVQAPHPQHAAPQGESRADRLGTGNGWRGNTPVEKRIIRPVLHRNWSVRLDLKIMWLT